MRREARTLVARCRPKVLAGEIVELQKLLGLDTLLLTQDVLGEEAAALQRAYRSFAFAEVFPDELLVGHRGALGASSAAPDAEQVLEVRR